MHWWPPQNLQRMLIISNIGARPPRWCPWHSRRTSWWWRRKRLSAARLNDLSAHNMLETSKQEIKMKKYILGKHMQKVIVTKRSRAYRPTIKWFVHRAALTFMLMRTRKKSARNEASTRRWWVNPPCWWDKGVSRGQDSPWSRPRIGKLPNAVIHRMETWRIFSVRLTG